MLRLSSSHFDPQRTNAAAMQQFFGTSAAFVRERIVRRGLRRPRHLIRRPFRLSELRNAIRRKFVTPMVIAVGSKSVGVGLPASQLELRRDGEAAESHRPLPQDGAATCPR